MGAGAAQGWFIAGTVPFILGGVWHILLTLRDTVSPTYFTPIDDAVRPAVDSTGVERIDAIRPLTIAFSAAFVALSLRFWFYGALIISATATACFTVAALLSA
jgi:hypothetical protein